MGDIEYNRLVWKCRRGMLELDLLLSKFLQSGYPKLSSDQKEQFNHLLDFPDPILFDLLFQHIEPSSELKPLIEQIHLAQKSKE